MGKFIVDSSFWELFPEAKIGVVLLKNMNNNKEVSDMVGILENANKEAKKYLVSEAFNENPVVAIYRNAYQKFKTKKGARCSIEALLKRVEKDNPVGNINPLVDIYNAASLTYGVPVGAEDIDTFVGDLKLTITEGGDEFFLIGEEENNPTLPGELCYKDDRGAVCRCFNWRDGERTMITDKTVNVFCVIECIEPSQFASLEGALGMIKELSDKYLDTESEVVYLDKNNPEVELKF